MYPVFESIKIWNGIAENLQYHRARMERTAYDLWGIKEAYENLEERMGSIPQRGLFKCKLSYYKKNSKVNIQVYEVKPLQRIYCLHDEQISYPYKYTDRSVFEQLQQNIQPSDDVLFIQKGLLTDSLYANIAAWNGKEWHTPSDPLLKGTKRQSLIDTNQIIEKSIALEHLNNYTKISLINAMLDLGDRCIDTKHIQVM
jgi:4-amino-4-deoxychorismate lyase